MVSETDLADIVVHTHFYGFLDRDVYNSEIYTHKSCINGFLKGHRPGQQ